MRERDYVHDCKKEAALIINAIKNSITAKRSKPTKSSRAPGLLISVTVGQKQK